MKDISSIPRVTSYNILHGVSSTDQPQLTVTRSDSAAVSVPTPPAPRRQKSWRNPDRLERSSVAVIQGAGLLLVRSCNGRIEVLIGQYEVRNALKSTKERPGIMRFPGEWHFPGILLANSDCLHHLLKS